MVASARGVSMRNVTIGQVIAPPAPIPSFTMRTGGDCIYLTDYESYWSINSSFSDTFDSGQIPPSATLDSPLIVNFTSVGTVIGNTVTDGDSGGSSAWEFTIGDLPGMAVIGYFPNGSTFTPASAFGGSTSTVSVYTSDGEYRYGLNLPHPAESWTTGDVIGIVYEGYSGNVGFFKNGIYQAAISRDNNLGRVIAGIVT